MKRFITIVLITSFSLPLFSQQTLYSYNRIWSTNHIIIKDSEYYKRLDEINRRNFEIELDYMKQAYNLLDGQDYERAIYFSNQINDNVLKCDSYFIKSISYLKMLKRRLARRYYNQLKSSCDPAKRRLLDEIFNEAGVSLKKRRGCFYYLFY